MKQKYMILVLIIGVLIISSAFTYADIEFEEEFIEMQNLYYNLRESS
ncbi:hypothetical protein [Natronospora cellulosivora (SeqCode)]